MNQPSNQETASEHIVRRLLWLISIPLVSPQPVAQRLAKPVPARLDRALANQDKHFVFSLNLSTESIHTRFRLSGVVKDSIICLPTGVERIVLMTEGCFDLILSHKTKSPPSLLHLLFEGHDQLRYQALGPLERANHRLSIIAQ